MIPQPLINIRSKGQGHRVKKWREKVATRQPYGAVSLRCDAAQRDGAEHELCTPLSAQPLHCEP